MYKYINIYIIHTYINIHIHMLCGLSCSFVISTCMRYNLNVMNVHLELPLSCDSELHAMVSTLCGGIFLRRCLEFLTGATLEHYLFTDSSSARQLATRQGVGKVKHVSGKLLWVQGAVLNKQVMLVQIQTLWNLSGSGTKPLSAKRLKLVLHELGVSTHDGQYVVGHME